MHKHDYITMQEVRRDVPGFLKRVAAGERLTVIYHSKPLVTVKNDQDESMAGKLTPGSPEAVRRSVAAAAEARAQARPLLDPNKSIKQLYAETIGKKYGIDYKET